METDINVIVTQVLKAGHFIKAYTQNETTYQRTMKLELIMIITTPACVNFRKYSLDNPASRIGLLKIGLSRG